MIVPDQDQNMMVLMDKTYFIGDNPRDCQAAYNAGSKNIYLGNKNELDHCSQEEQPQLVVRTLEEGIPYLVEL